jgi:hypothetical protein
VLPVLICLLLLWLLLGVAGLLLKWALWLVIVAGVLFVATAVIASVKRGD